MTRLNKGACSCVCRPIQAPSFKHKESPSRIKDPLWKEWCSQLDVSPNLRESITFGNSKKSRRLGLLRLKMISLSRLEVLTPTLYLALKAYASS
jgi:hypothetical protein